jgi:hypothetical protein
MNHQPADEQPPLPESELQERHKALMLLLQEWLQDESGYEEATWPIVQRLIEENALSSRRRFSQP